MVDLQDNPFSRSVPGEPTSNPLLPFADLRVLAGPVLGTMLVDRPVFGSSGHLQIGSYVLLLMEKRGGSAGASKTRFANVLWHWFELSGAEFVP